MSDSYISFIPEIEPSTSPSDDDLLFIFRGNDLLVCINDGIPNLPSRTLLESLFPCISSLQYFGKFEGQSCYTGEITDGSFLPSVPLTFLGLRAFMTQTSDDLFFLAGRAVQILHWHKTHQFCGSCGSPTVPKKGERAKLCPSCGALHYPHIAPAIIVAVVRGDKLLLAHNVQFNSEMYSIIAGFVEPGETFEECVKREVMEEVGIQVKNIKYFGSQPWPFPNSLMIGFTAEYNSGEISVDTKEIDKADWFEIKDFPFIPTNKSIARKLINWFIDTHQPQNT